MVNINVQIEDCAAILYVHQLSLIVVIIQYSMCVHYLLLMSVLSESMITINIAITSITVLDNILFLNIGENIVSCTISIIQIYLYQYI